MKQKHVRIAVGSLTALFTIVLGASVLPNSAPQSLPPRPLPATSPADAAPQPAFARTTSSRDRNYTPYTFADEMEALPLPPAGDTIRPPHLGGAALRPHHDHQALPPARPLAWNAIGGAGARTGSGSGTPHGTPASGAASGNAQEGAQANDSTHQPNTDAGNSENSEEPSTGQEQTAEQPNRPEQPPELPIDPLPELPNTPNGNTPPATAVPEPSSLALLAIGLLMLGALRRRPVAR